MTTEEAKTRAAAVHKMATKIVQSFHKKHHLHPTLTEVLPWFEGQMLQLSDGRLPTSRLEAAKVFYLTTTISGHTVDEVAAAYLQLASASETNTVAE